MISFVLSLISKNRLVIFVVAGIFCWFTVSYFSNVVSNNRELNRTIIRLEAKIATIEANNKIALETSYQQIAYERARYENAKVVYKQAEKRLANEKCAKENIPPDVLNLLYGLDEHAEASNTNTDEHKRELQDK